MESRRHHTHTSLSVSKGRRFGPVVWSGLFQFCTPLEPILKAYCRCEKWRTTVVRFPSWWKRKIFSQTTRQNFFKLGDVFILPPPLCRTFSCDLHHRLFVTHQVHNGGDVRDVLAGKQRVPSWKRLVHRAGRLRVVVVEPGQFILVRSRQLQQQNVYTVFLQLHHTLRQL